MTQITEERARAIDKTARYVLENSRRGTSLNSEQFDADTSKLMTAYRDIIGKALASGHLALAQEAAVPSAPDGRVMLPIEQLGGWFSQALSMFCALHGADADDQPVPVFIREMEAHLLTASPAPPQDAGEGEAFQARVQPWMMACFGQMIAGDREERNHRFLEEALELVQACGCTASEAHQLVDYVYGRPVGEPAQEVGGVMVTLAALCLANDLDMHEAAEKELARIWTKVEAIRAKQAAKPKHSPLPEALTTPPAALSSDAVERASERVIQALAVYAHRDWSADPIQETEREWARPIARAALGLSTTGEGERDA